ncbi:unnamed protein product [Amoebophrya sp. A25]|nr:unnamed protein product [Amoebophrya sp. A25]|eukprot:GSA25T00001375001.1
MVTSSTSAAPEPTSGLLVGTSPACSSKMSLESLVSAHNMPIEGLTPEEMEDVHGIPYINKYCATHHKNAFVCSFLKEKGRILTADRDYEEGDVVMEEPPLHIVHETKKSLYMTKLKALYADKGLDYEPLWYWCALNSLTDEDLAGRVILAADPDGPPATLKTISKEQQYRLLLLYHGDIGKPSEDVSLIVETLELGQDPALALLLERLLQVWILNCFEHSENPLGYSTYFMSSFMSHSCLPNVVWHYRDDSLFVLRARRKVRKGDEICCSYLAEEALLESAQSRRNCLEESKHFVCTCERCRSGADLSRGFLCPWCKVGCIFPNVDQATPKFTLTKEEDSTDENSVMKEHQRAAPFQCNQCDKFHWESDWGGLWKAEKESEKLFKNWETLIEKNNRVYGSAQGTVKSLTEAKLLTVLERTNMVFSQHWVQERLWSIAQEFYEQSRDFDRAMHYTRLRIKFHQNAYPGINGARAWALESLGELLFKSTKSRSFGMDQCGRWFHEAIAVYDEAVSVLEVMFGKGHEYCKSVLNKREKVMTRLKQWSAAKNVQPPDGTDQIGPPTDPIGPPKIYEVADANGVNNLAGGQFSFYPSSTPSPEEQNDSSSEVADSAEEASSDAG